MASTTDVANSYTYDVFLSFRGKDTRLNFTDHLHNALCQRGIKTFRDDDQLRRGKKISAALLKAIEESRVSIIVFSKNYASSRWCLDELLKILECRESKGQEVRPVFYKVDPSHVRHQTGRVGKAFAKLYQCKYKDSMSKWKKALEEAAELAGWHFKKGEYEAEFIKKIIDELSDREVNPSQKLHVAEHPIGIESCRQDINRLLDVQENVVRMVGIWGTGGIGKTTIAKDVYNSIRHKFEANCFLEVVGSNSSSDQGLAQLQETLLRDILGDSNLKVCSVDRGVSFIKERMKHKKVLLILDDVSHSNQLQKLAPSPDCFGKGSRIIITTRDKRWLTAHQVDSIYEVKMLDDDRALELFSWNAFKCNGPPDNYLKLGQRAVRYAQGLPLALIVLGAHLFGRSRDEWEATLDGCNGFSEIRDVLKISYYALGEDYLKEMFLDIACFFIGKHVDHVIPILGACDRNPTIGIVLVQEKALIRIDRDDVIWMHALIEEMGKNIVLQEGEPGERSRLWNCDDVNHVLTDNTGTHKIKSIQVKWQEDEIEIRLNAKSFLEMKNLRYFSSSENVCYSAGNIDFLSNKLRWLNWSKCPILSFPSNFYPRELVALNISDSCHIRRLWEGRKICPNLTSMELSCCASLMELPDLSGIHNLKKLTLFHCDSLVEVHHSVGFLDRLVTLDIIACSILVMLPREISLKLVQTISIINCKRLEEFPKIIGKMDSLRNLDLSRSGIKELHPSIGNLTGLTRLCLNGCENLTTLPCNMYDLLQNLEIIGVIGCPKLATFPKVNGNMGSLRELDLSGSGIKELHPSIGHLIGLEELYIHNCENLSTLPCSIDGLQHLETLNLSECSKLSTFPEIHRKMDSLRELDLSGSGIKELHPSIGYLIGLEELYLQNCENLSTLPCSIYGLQNLELLNLSKCSKLVTFPANTKSLHDDNGDGSLSLPKLEVFLIQGCHLSDADFIMTLNCWETLTELDLSSNNFVSLPACISKFVNLEKLDLHCCKRLHEIPELPPNLIEVDVSDCESVVKFSKLSKVLEGKESQGIEWINLWNCHRLCDNLGYNMDKLERIFLYNQENSPFGVVFPGSITAEVANWFNCWENVTGQEIVPCNCNQSVALRIWPPSAPQKQNVPCNNISDCECSIPISKNLKWENIGLAICVVFKEGKQYYSDFEISINEVCIIPFGDDPWTSPSSSSSSSTSDQKGCSWTPPYYDQKGCYYMLESNFQFQFGCPQSKEDAYFSSRTDSTSDHVLLEYIPLPVERKAEVDDQKGCSSPLLPYYMCRVRFVHRIPKGISKSCGVHLVCQQSKDDEYSSNKVVVEPTQQNRHRTGLLESENPQLNVVRRSSGGSGAFFLDQV